MKYNNILIKNMFIISLLLLNVGFLTAKESMFKDFELDYENFSNDQPSLFKDIEIDYPDRLLDALDSKYQSKIGRVSVDNPSTPSEYPAQYDYNYYNEIQPRVHKQKTSLFDDYTASKPSHRFGSKKYSSNKNVQNINKNEENIQQFSTEALQQLAQTALQLSRTLESQNRKEPDKDILSSKIVSTEPPQPLTREDTRLKDLKLAIEIIRLLDDKKDKSQNSKKQTETEKMKLYLAQSLFNPKLNSLKELERSQRDTIDSVINVMQRNLQSDHSHDHDHDDDNDSEENDQISPSDIFFLSPDNSEINNPGPPSPPIETNYLPPVKPFQRPTEILTLENTYLPPSSNEKVVSGVISVQAPVGPPLSYKSRRKTTSKVTGPPSIQLNSKQNTQLNSNLGLPALTLPLETEGRTQNSWKPVSHQSHQLKNSDPALYLNSQTNDANNLDNDYSIHYHYHLSNKNGNTQTLSNNANSNNNNQKQYTSRGQKNVNLNNINFQSSINQIPSNPSPLAVSSYSNLNSNDQVQNTLSQPAALPNIPQQQQQQQQQQVIQNQPIGSIGLNNQQVNQIPVQNTALSSNQGNQQLFQSTATLRPVQTPLSQYAAPPAQAPRPAYGAPPVQAPTLRPAYGAPPVQAPTLRPAYGAPPVQAPTLRPAYGPPPAQAPVMMYGAPPQNPPSPPPPPQPQSVIVISKSKKEKKKPGIIKTLIDAFKKDKEDKEDKEYKDEIRIFQTNPMSVGQQDMPFRNSIMRNPSSIQLEQQLEQQVYFNERQLFEQKRELDNLNRLQTEMIVQDFERQRLRNELINGISGYGYKEDSSLKEIFYKGAVLLGAMTLLPLSKIVAFGRKRREVINDDQSIRNNTLTRLIDILPFDINKLPDEDFYDIQKSMPKEAALRQPSCLQKSFCLEISKINDSNLREQFIAYYKSLYPSMDSNPLIHEVLIKMEIKPKCSQFQCSLSNALL